MQGLSESARYPWFKTAYWEEIRARHDELAGEEGEEVGRASVHFHLLSHHLLFALTPFQLLASARDPSGPDGWEWTRAGVEANGLAVDASTPLLALGLETQLERNREIVQLTMRWIDERAGEISEQERAAALEALVITRPGPAPGSPTRGGGSEAWGRRSKELGHPTQRSERDFHLQRPLDQHFRSVRPGIRDRRLLELVGSWIGDIERNYLDLVRGIPADSVEHADLAFDAVATAAPEIGIGMSSPAEMRTEERETGDVRDSETVATHVLVSEDAVLPQPDGIALMPGERWMIRGHRLQDETVMPCWGTHRTVPSDTGYPGVPAG